MQSRPTFARQLMGQPPQARPPFFYAYLLFWLHLLGSLGYRAFTTADAWQQDGPFLVLSALSIALVLYAILARRYWALGNLLAYALALLSLRDGLEPALQLIPALLPLPSLYLVLLAEYRTYAGKATSHLWSTLLVALGVVLLCLYGLWLEGVL